MLYADNAGIVSKAAEGLAKMMTVIVTIFESAGLTVSKKETETMLLRTLNQVLPISPLVVEAAGQRYMQMVQLLYLGDLTDASADIMPENKPTDPTRVGMLRSFQARAVRYGGCPVHIKVAPANDRGDGGPAVRVCDLDSRPGALR